MNKQLIVYLDETDMHDDLPLYEAVCRRLNQMGAPGTTVLAGIMGFGSQHHIHRKRLFGVSDDRPIQISVVADEAFLREKAIPAIRPMLKDGLMFLIDVEVISPI